MSTINENAIENADAIKNENAINDEHLSRILEKQIELLIRELCIKFQEANTLWADAYDKSYEASDAEDAEFYRAQKQIKKEQQKEFEKYQGAICRCSELLQTAEKYVADSVEFREKILNITCRH